MSKRILFLSDNSLLHPIVNSQGLPLLNDLRGKGYQISLVTFEKGREQSEAFHSRRAEMASKGFVHYPVYMPKNLFLSGRMWLWLLGLLMGLRVMFAVRPHLIHVRSYPPMLIALMIRFFTPCKIIFDMRGIYVDEELEAGLIRKDSLFYKMERTLEGVYLKNCDACVSVSVKHQEFINSLYSSLNVAVKNYFIPNTTDVSRFSDNNHIWDKKRISLLYVGNYVIKYDVDTMLAFFTELSAVTECSLKIITYEDPAELIRKIGLLPPQIGANIIVTKSPSEKMPEEMNNHTAGLAVLNPILSNTVCAPIKVVEYLASGLPVIITENTGDATGIISQYRAGIVLDKNDLRGSALELIALLNDSELSARCKFAAEREFNLKDSVKKYEKIYQNLLGA